MVCNHQTLRNSPEVEELDESIRNVQTRCSNPGRGMFSVCVTNRHELSAKESPPQKSKETLRVGFVGIGNKGSQHVRNLLHIDGVEMVAVCDILTEPCMRTQRACRHARRCPNPSAYTGGEYEFRRMCDERRPRLGLHRNAVAVARAGLSGRHEQRFARGN